LSTALDAAAAPFQEIFSTRGSPLSKVDARLKIVCAVLWSVQAAGLFGFSPALAALGGSLFLIALARWPLGNLLKRLSAVNFFIAFMWLMLPFSFSTPGRTIASLGPLDVTYEGVQLAGLLTLKANAIVIAVIALLGTTPLHLLAAACRAMRFPEKLVGVFLLAVRYFQVMRQEYLRLRRAMRARGFKMGASSNALRGASNLVGSLLVRSFDRAERVHKAMVCRGYAGVVHVKSDFRLKAIDAAMALCMLALSGLVGGLEWRR
jgi:cobalt/nickel transport system permease protein